MAEPVAMTLAALAMLDPAIRTVRQAYGAYELTKHFGEHYIGVQRRLNGEKARLEVALETHLATMPESGIITEINEHLGQMSNHFQACQDMIADIDGRTSACFLNQRLFQLANI